MRRLVLLSTCLAVLLAAEAASAAPFTFTNATPITIPDSGQASPYPSTIVVGNLTGVIGDVNVTLGSFSHTCPSDVDVLLVGPGGQRTILYSDAGGNCSPAAANVTFSLDDEAAAAYPCLDNPSGAFKPTDNACFSDADPFPAPAPAGPHPVSLAVFDGTSPNGTWSLYVFDEYVGDMGSFATGWSMTIDIPAPTNTGLPSITGTPRNGRVLTALNGSWAGSPSSFAYQWLRCAASCTAIIGATASSYTLRTVDVGKRIVVRVTASNSGGSTAAQSAPTAVVSPKPGACTNVLTGTSRGEILNGTRGGDRIRGLGGRDRLNGLAGRDCLNGGRGNDRLTGGRGNDRLTGGAGADVLNCGAGRDVARIDRRDRTRGCEVIRFG
jgi:subtilisin-like proprotein convertase family protein